MTEDEFVKETQFLHEQNLNGREDFLEAFEKGIRAAYQEFTEDKIVDVVKDAPVDEDIVLNMPPKSVRKATLVIEDNGQSDKWN